ncbi:MAG: acetylornithine transaminase [Candidatus Tectomicrobia bacterium]|uniref:Acetylornithine aminotransferase n=1 Tax=Tectimicrobiota bacterium TaxID=2528274 RepID=A0A933GMK8_UNCTE|nr:acetylornithine transaminase [Candidatus Tectomicrobia bacterium]
MTNSEYVDLANKYLCHNYGRLPIALQRGEGIKVWDCDGKLYYDFVSGIAVNNLGHCHPRVAKALAEQASTLFHVSNLYHIPNQIDLARYLVEHSFADKAFFCNSGAEANEAAIKLARKYSLETFGPNRYEIITMLGSFHGRTMATLTATGQEKVKIGYAPLLEGFKHCPFNDLRALEKSVTEKTCAIMMEPILGEGGVMMPSAGFLQDVKKMCESRNLLLIFDEVQTGIGRTGKLFAYEHYHVTPDIMTLAKSLAAGFPIGAMLATDQVASVFGPGSHASTFGGNPLATRAALTTLKVIEEEHLLANCSEMGHYLMKGLNQLKDKYPFIKDVRGTGLLIGMELDREGAPFVAACQEKGFLINCIQGKVLRFLPALIVSHKEIDLLFQTLDEVFSNQ